MEFIDMIRLCLWGRFTILFMLITGIYMTISSRFVQFWGIKSFLKQFTYKHDKNEISPINALFTSLGGTLGVGNLAGVATAIYMGGPGAIFWMMVVSFFGMATKYSEILLACRFSVVRDQNRIGGAMVYLKTVVHSRFLSIIFTVFCILSSIVMGAFTGGNAICSAINTVAEIPYIFCSIIAAFFLFMVISRSSTKITKFSTFIVPLMSFFYIFGGILVLLINRHNIIPALQSILTDAFSPASASGGVMGFLTSSVVSEGFSRGVFSNEAGLGSAPIAHSSANFKNPAEQGVLGVLEVFIDSFIMCLLTALVILTSTATIEPNGIHTVSSAFASVFGNFSIYFIAISICLLAFTSIIGWSFYGIKCLEYFELPYIKIYKALLVLFCALGAFSTLRNAFIISDIFTALMTFPNLIAIWVLAPYVKMETKRYRKK